MRADLLEQVFVRRSGGAKQLLLVLESRAGARQRVTLNPPVGDEAAAVDYLARYLDLHGITLARRPRLRVERGGELRDAPELLARLRAAVTGPAAEGGA